MKFKNDNLFLDCHFGSDFGMATGSSDFLEDLKEVLSFKNEYYPNQNQNCSLAI